MEFLDDPSFGTAQYYASKCQPAGFTAVPKFSTPVVSDTFCAKLVNTQVYSLYRSKKRISFMTSKREQPPSHSNLMKESLSPSTQEHQWVAS